MPAHGPGSSADDDQAPLDQDPVANLDDNIDEPVDSVTDEPAAAPDPFQDDFIYAPAGHCDDPANLHTVWNVVDGDTIVIASSQKVRYIGVDAPETYKSECWSGEAKHALQKLTPEKSVVCLLMDKDSSPTDPYGRLLRYVFVDEGGDWVMANSRRVRQGAARAYHQFLKGKDYSYEIKQAEYAAKDDHLGLWANCN